MTKNSKSVVHQFFFKNNGGGYDQGHRGNQGYGGGNQGYGGNRGGGGDRWGNSDRGNDDRWGNSGGDRYRGNFIKSHIFSKNNLLYENLNFKF